MTPQELTAAIQSGGLTPRQAYHIFAALWGTTRTADELVIPCEECGTLTPWPRLVSYKVWLPHPGHPALAGFDLDVEQTCNGQHYCCSPACAAEQVRKCVAEHHEPERARRVALAEQGIVRPALIAHLPQRNDAPTPGDAGSL